MAVAFTRVSLWLWGAGGAKDHHREPPSSAGSPMNASPDFGFRDLENNIKHPQGKGAKMRSARPRRKWQSREERWRKVDREFDVVLVPSDGGGCLSGSDSDDSDWSIGWLEPHAPDFFSDGGGYESEVETSFAVLVPCYGRGRNERAGEGPSYNNRVLTAADLTGGSFPRETTSMWNSCSLLYTAAELAVSLDVSLSSRLLKREEEGEEIEAKKGERSGGCANSPGEIQSPLSPPRSEDGLWNSFCK